MRTINVDGFSLELSDDGKKLITVTPPANDGRILDISHIKTLHIIEESAFYKCENLTKIKLPDSIVTICYRAFANLYQLETVDLPAELMTIGAQAFVHCSKLAMISFPGTLEHIGESAFCNCDALKKVALPAKIRKVGRLTFGYCSSLETVALPAKLQTIEDRAFNQCTNLRSITLPAGLSRLDQFAFKDCNKLSGVTLSLPEQKEMAMALEHIHQRFEVLNKEGDSLFIKPFKNTVTNAGMFASTPPTQTSESQAVKNPPDVNDATKPLNLTQRLRKA